jgi:hypothetical protein
MWREGQRVRFYTAAGVQIGPQHANVVPAVIWAGAHAWIAPTHPRLSMAVTAEVRAESRRFDECHADAGAWEPMPVPDAGKERP